MSTAFLIGNALSWLSFPLIVINWCTCCRLPCLLFSKAGWVWLALFYIGFIFSVYWVTIGNYVLVLEFENLIGKVHVTKMLTSMTLALLLNIFFESYWSQFYSCQILMFLTFTAWNKETNCRPPQLKVCALFIL